MSDAFTITVVIIFFAFLMGMVVYLIHQLVQSKDGQIDSLMQICEQKNDQIINLVSERDALRDELDNLKSRKRLRQTGPTVAGLEDVGMILTRMKFERQYEDELLDASLRTISQLRQGPYEYDPETKSVKRER